MNHTILAFGHRKGVGKSTVAELASDHIAKQHNRTVVTLSFALPVKELAHQYFGHLGVEHHRIYDRHPELKDRVLESMGRDVDITCMTDPEPVMMKVGKTPRKVWCELGEAMRVIYPNVFIDQVKRQIDSWVAGDLVFLIHDLRLKAEFEAVKSWGGVCVKVERGSVAKGGGATESELDDVEDWDPLNGAKTWDGKIANEGSQSQLDDHVKALMDTIFSETATD